MKMRVQTVVRAGGAMLLAGALCLGAAAPAAAHSIGLSEYYPPVSFGPDEHPDGDHQQDGYHVETVGYTHTERVPEPATLVMMGAGLAGVALLARRRRA
jgi:hypothetical protein